MRKGERLFRLELDEIGLAATQRLLRRHTSPKLAKPGDEPMLSLGERRRLLDLLHHADDPGLAELAELFDRSPVEAARSFRRTFGASPQERMTTLKRRPN